MAVWIIYSLVIIFFLAFPLLVVSFARQPEVSTQAQSNTKNASHIDKVSYGLLAAFFVLFSLLTFVIHRNKP